MVLTGKAIELRRGAGRPHFVSSCKNVEVWCGTGNCHLMPTGEAVELRRGTGASHLVLAYEAVELWGGARKCHLVRASEAIELRRSLRIGACDAEKHATN